MGTFQREYEHNLQSAITTLGVSPEGFHIYHDGLFVRIRIPDGRVIKISIDQRVMNDEGMTTAICMRLQACGVGRTKTNFHLVDI